MHLAPPAALREVGGTILAGFGRGEGHDVALMRRSSGCSPPGTVLCVETRSGLVVCRWGVNGSRVKIALDKLVWLTSGFRDRLDPPDRSPGLIVERERRWCC